MFFRRWYLTSLLIVALSQLALSGGMLRFASDTPLVVGSDETSSVSLSLEYTGRVGLAAIQFKVIMESSVLHFEDIVASPNLDRTQWGFDYNIRGRGVSTPETLLVVLYARTLTGLAAGEHRDLFTIHFKASTPNISTQCASFQIRDVVSALADGLGSPAGITADPRRLTFTVATVQDFALEQNSPNPFNPSTLIRFKIPNTSRVNIAVFNELGQQVTVLLDGLVEAGTSTVHFDGMDRNGSMLPSGVYFCRMTTENFVDSKKMLLLK